MKHPASHTLICIGIALSVGAPAACSDSSTPSTQVASPPAAATGGIVAKQSDQEASDAAIFANGIVTKRKACDLMIRPDAEVAVGQPLQRHRPGRVGIRRRARGAGTVPVHAEDHRGRVVGPKTRSSSSVHLASGFLP